MTRTQLTALLAFVAGSACGTVREPCTGVSGLEYAGPDTDNWTCSRFVNATGVIVPTLAKNVLADKRFREIDLTGWALYVHPDRSWVDNSNGKWVAGLAYCDSRILVVGNSPWRESALAHEIAHAVQNCEPLGPVDKSDPGHSNWGRDGIISAVESTFDAEME